MHFLRLVLLTLFVLTSLLSSAQKKKKVKVNKEEAALIAGLQTHIGYLADDKLEGRRAGSAGEALAKEYISRQFTDIGLLPKGTSGFYQPFDINDGKEIKPATHLLINGEHQKTGTDFFPLAYSPNLSLEALATYNVQEVDMPWFTDLSEILEENKNNPHFDFTDHIKNRAKKAKSRGATVLFLYNSSAIPDNLKFDPKDKSELLPLPVIYLTPDAAKRLLKEDAATLDIKLKVEIGEKKRTGHNVVGFIDNGAARTVVLGAHFDHLGYGEDGNSMLRTGDKLIHNGADDNASGTAALIELARKLKTPTKSKDQNIAGSNYLFIAFSGEELGLYGSKYYVENPTIDLKTINYMINMDMVGRLNDSTNTITLGGYGTSPVWSRVISTDPRNGQLPFTIKIDSSGTGPSDHTSFYRKDIPVLFFFTGLHTDYHKPTDDADRINYTGQVKIINYIYNLVASVSRENEKLTFTKTRETQTTTSARFSVSMGVMPDYTFSGTGMRCDGVSEGKPAQKAGIKAGDVITGLGEHPVTSVESYMQALGKFKKGDATKVKLKRGNEELLLDVQF